LFEVTKSGENRTPRNPWDPERWPYNRPVQALLSAGRSWPLAQSAASVAKWQATAVSGVYLRHGGTYIAMRETPYGAEDVLQQLIEEHPEMLGGEDAPHGPLVLVRREAGVSDEADAGARWSLDHLYVDADGIPTLVEVKRSSDTRSRREVVAQMLDG
jgi:hypothetical protein